MGYALKPQLVFLPPSERVCNSVVLLNSDLMILPFSIIRSELAQVSQLQGSPRTGPNPENIAL